MTRSFWKWAGGDHVFGARGFWFQKAITQWDHFREKNILGVLSRVMSDLAFIHVQFCCLALSYLAYLHYLWLFSILSHVKLNITVVNAMILWTAWLNQHLVAELCTASNMFGSRLYPGRGHAGCYYFTFWIKPASSLLKPKLSLWVRVEYHVKHHCEKESGIYNNKRRTEEKRGGHEISGHAAMYCIWWRTWRAKSRDWS